MKEKLKRDPRSSPDERIFRAVCRPNCFGFCPHDVVVRDGRIVKSAPATLPDPRYGDRICLRGLTNLQRVYDENRVKWPMKRVGPRGAGQWERISWNEAIEFVTSNWKSISAEFGPAANAVHSGSGNAAALHGAAPGMTSRLSNVLGFTTVPLSVDASITQGVQAVIGNNGPWPGNGPEDLVNAKTIILLGNNTTEAQIHMWHHFQDAKDAGAKIIVIDPVFTHAAAQAHEFLPIRPGSDPALLLSIAHCLARDEKYNVEFLQRKTVAPYLVKDADGMFLRMSDLGHAGDDRAAVMGQDGNVGPVDEIAAPQLRCETTVEGFVVRTAFELVLDRLNEYPPELVAEISHVSADRIEELAREIHAGPTTIRAGWGGQAYDNGTMVGRTLMLLAALTGYIGAKGSDMGAQWEMFLGINFGFAAPTGRVGPAIESVVLPEVMRSGKFKGEDFPVKSLYCYQTNILGNVVNQNSFKADVVDKMDFICVVDLAMTDTARWADLVLPAAHWYEMNDIVVGMGYHPYLQFSEKVVEPQFEAKPDGDIIRLLAEKMGVGEYFDKTDDEYFQELLDTDFCRQRDISYERLLEERAIRVMPNPWLAYGGNQNFNTSDNRMHIYNEVPHPRFDYGQDPLREREKLPSFFPPNEAWPGTEAQMKYPLVLISERPRHRVHGQWFDTPWLREIDPVPTVKINPNDAKVRDIQNGDEVEVYNDRGTAVAKAVYSDAIMEGLLVYPKGWQRHQHKAGSFSELSSEKFDPLGVNQSFFDATCEIRKWSDD